MSIVARMAFMVILTSLLLWISIYFWFVPANMRPPVTIAAPSLWVKIIVSIVMLVMAVSTLQILQVVSLAMRRNTVEKLSVLIGRIYLGIYIVALVGIVRLFLPIFGQPPISSSEVLAWFGEFTILSCVQITRRGLSLGRGPTRGTDFERRVAVPSADDAMRADRRPPILYLRSFEEEARRGGFWGSFDSPRIWSAMKNESAVYLHSGAFAQQKRRSMGARLIRSNRSLFDEQMLLASYFSTLGPYIAIGRPGETFQNMDLGASKKYVANADWRRVVTETIHASAAIVLEVGRSDGLLWEMEQVVERAYPRQVLLICPLERQLYDKFIWYTQRIWPKPLPEIMPMSRFITFDDNWTPIELAYEGVLVSDTLGPFCARNGLLALE